MAQPGMARPGPARPNFFFALKRLFDPIGPIFRTGWAVKIFGPKKSGQFWPGPLLALPSPARPTRLTPLGGGRYVFYFIFFIFFSRFSLRYTEIGPSEFVGARSKVLYSMRATHENQKHGISPSFYLKFGKSSVLVFLRSTAFCRLELVGVECQTDPRIASYAWVPKYWSFVKLHKVWIFT